MTIMKKAKKRQARYANRNAKYTEFQIGDSVYVKKRQRLGFGTEKCPWNW